MRFDDSRAQQIRLWFAKWSPLLNIVHRSPSYLTGLSIRRGGPTRAHIAEFRIGVCGVEPDQSQL